MYNIHISIFIFYRHHGDIGLYVNLNFELMISSLSSSPHALTTSCRLVLGCEIMRLNFDPNCPPSTAILMYLPSSMLMSTLAQSISKMIYGTLSDSPSLRCAQSPLPHCVALSLLSLTALRSVSSPSLATVMVLRPLILFNL
jgi:hypothetical protein